MKIAEDVYLVGSGALGTAATHDCDCNVYALRCGSEYVLIDAGVGRDSERLAENLLADGIRPGALRRLLLTHYHLDHAGGARWFRDHWQVAVCATAATALAVRRGDEEAISLGAAKRAGVYPQDFAFPPCPVDHVLDAGSFLHLEDTVIEAVPAAGHSRDMTCYLVRKPGRTLLFSGDALFHGGKIGLQDTHDCDVPDSVRTVRRLGGHDIDELYPGHMLWVVRDARSHLLKATRLLDQLLLPPNLFGAP